jgi:hypothetical protein
MAFGLRKSRWAILHEEISREAAEARQFNRELLIRLEKTYAGLGSAFDLMGGQIERMGERIERMGERIEANTEEVRAQTDAIMQLLDHFKGSNGGPPV